MTLSSPVPAGANVRDRGGDVRAGETVRYEAVPIYRGSELIPRGVTLRATGDGGFRLHVTVLNRVP